MKTFTIKKQDGEYRVRLFIDGIHQSGADYFTDCRKDAQATAKRMVETGVQSDKDCDTARSEAQDLAEETGYFSSLKTTEHVKAMAKALQSAGIAVETDWTAGTVVAGELFRALQKGAGQPWIVRHVSDLFA